MNDALKLIDTMITEKLFQVHTAYIAKVVSVAGDRAVIQPLHKAKEKGVEAVQYPVIQNVPIASYPLKGKITGTASLGEASGTLNCESQCTYTLNVQSGAIVLVVACERSIDEGLTGNIYLPITGKHHSINDSVIVAVISQGGAV